MAHLDGTLAEVNTWNIQCPAFSIDRPEATSTLYFDEMISTQPCSGYFNHGNAPVQSLHGADYTFAAETVFVRGTLPHHVMHCNNYGDGASVLDIEATSLYEEAFVVSELNGFPPDGINHIGASAGTGSALGLHGKQATGGMTVFGPYTAATSDSIPWLQSSVDTTTGLLPVETLRRTDVVSQSGPSSCPSSAQPTPLRTQLKVKLPVPPCHVCAKSLSSKTEQRYGFQQTISMAEFDRVRKHINMHLRPFTCSQPDCPRQAGFASLADLSRHQKSVHGIQPLVGAQGWYSCAVPDCLRQGQRWPRRDNFVQHAKRMHPDLNLDTIIET